MPALDVRHLLLRARIVEIPNRHVAKHNLMVNVPGTWQIAGKFRGMVLRISAVSAGRRKPLRLNARIHNR
jgi:hypothetical protein